MKLLTCFAFVAIMFATTISADEYKVDASHSMMAFKVKHLGVSYTHGRFNDFKGNFTFDANDTSKNSISIKIAAKSIDSNSAKRDDHLRGKDFFFVKKYKTLSFESTSFKKKEGSKNEFIVEGTMKMHGKKKTITVDAKLVGEGKDPWGGYRCGFSCSFTIKRSDFGMKYMIGGISDEVHITADVEGIRK
ncbi:YceI family protein [Candidatus Uabimicrobium sp. HlEnr_7]|uniref:YceI family protein n=1 Tax=Candidatus Uabimicrobium helgolandensis TaxID=3095367 RepID=UPI003555D3F6